MKIMLLIAAATITAPALANAEALDLVCRGTALHTESTSTFGSVTANNGEDASGQATTYGRVRSEESMRVRIDGSGAGKLKLPQVLVPFISRGRDGWWDFTTISVTDDAIRGQFSLNILNHPTVMIDRHTGDIDMKGMGMKFSGSCEQAPENTENKKF